MPTPSPALLTASDHQRQVGARLRRLATALDLKLVDMAKIMGCSKQTMNSYLNGQVYPNDYGIYRLCRLYRVDYNYLYLGDWSGLPAKLAARLEPEYAALQGGGGEPGLVANETQPGDKASGGEPPNKLLLVR